MSCCGKSMLVFLDFVVPANNDYGYILETNSLRNDCIRRIKPCHDDILRRKLVLNGQIEEGVLLSEVYDDKARYIVVGTVEEVSRKIQPKQLLKG